MHLSVKSMPFPKVLKELQRPRSSAIILQNGDPRTISSSVEPCKEAPAVVKSETTGPESRPQSATCFTDANGRRALHYAAATGHLQVVKELAANPENVSVKDISGYTPLHLAATEGHVEVVKALLRSGANPDVQDDVHGNTALHEAAWKGYSQTAEVLCKRNSHMSIKNKGGFSALHLACQQGHNQTCRILLLYSCSPDIKNNYGDTPLHTAARYGHAGVVRILISAFCTVNAVNKNTDTALHISAAMGRRKLTKILLESGCDPTIKNKQGETAMDIALRKSFKEVQEIIANAPPVAEVKPYCVSHKEDTSIRNHKHSKKHKSKSAHKSVHFSASSKYPHNSPYGCPMYPNMEDFPKPKLDSLPTEPLAKGEQYYVDLAGNIRKGPVGKVFNCYCVPLFEKVEAKMEKDKEELKQHIHTCHDNLDKKITSVEEKTSHQLIALNEVVKEKLSGERVQCLQRNYRRSLKDRLEFERQTRQQVEKLRGEMRDWLESKLISSNAEEEPETHPINISDNHYVNVRPRKNSAESDSQVFYDRPKSCFGMRPQGNFPNVHGGSVGDMSRSKSETHLAACTDSERDVISEKNAMNRVVACNDVRHSNDNSQLWHGDAQQQIRPPMENGNSCEQLSSAVTSPVSDNIRRGTEQLTDMMKLMYNGSPPVPNGNCRNSPFNDSGYRTKFSPSPKVVPSILKQNGDYRGKSTLSENMHTTQIISRDNGELTTVPEYITQIPKKSSLV